MLPNKIEALSAVLRNHTLTRLAVALGLALLLALPPQGFAAENFRKLKDARSRQGSLAWR